MLGLLRSGASVSTFYFILFYVIILSSTERTCWGAFSAFFVVFDSCFKVCGPGWW